jgi:hypothetical protein
MDLLNNEMFLLKHLPRSGHTKIISLSTGTTFPVFISINTLITSASATSISVSFIVVVKKTFRYLNGFSTTTYTAIPYFGTYLRKGV